MPLGYPVNLQDSGRWPAQSDLKNENKSVGLVKIIRCFNVDWEFANQGQ